MASPTLVIFDNDGVVVDSEPIANAVCAEVLTSLGFPCTFEYSVQHFLGRSLASARAHVEALLGGTLAPEFEDRYHALLYERFDAALEAVPGVEAVLDSCPLPFCLASSGTHARIRRSLGQVALLGRFEGHIHSAEDVEHGKPAPDLFLAAAAGEGHDPAACIVVEDSPAGVEAGRAAGMVTIGFAALTPRGRLAGADLIVSSMAELGRALSGRGTELLLWP